MFAEATPEPNGFLQFWIIVGFLASVIGSVVSVVVMLANRKQKREVSFSFEPASKVEFERHVEWNRREHESLHSKIGGVERGSNAMVEKIRQEISEMERRLLGQGEMRAEKLHLRINDVLSSVSEVKGICEARGKGRDCGPMR